MGGSIPLWALHHSSVSWFGFSSGDIYLCPFVVVLMILPYHHALFIPLCLDPGVPLSCKFSPCSVVFSLLHRFMPPSGVIFSSPLFPPCFVLIKDPSLSFSGWNWICYILKT